MSLLDVSSLQIQSGFDDAAAGLTDEVFLLAGFISPDGSVRPGVRPRPGFRTRAGRSEVGDTPA